jgi:Lon protease-like protein
MASRMVFLPPTTDFPPDPEPLSREDLNSVYLELRNCYKSSMRSRGQHRSLATKAREETAQLKQRLLDLAAREASVRTDIYQMLEIVTRLQVIWKMLAMTLSTSLGATNSAARPIRVAPFLVDWCRR